MRQPTEVVGGKAADVICAAYFASEAALHLLRAGNTNAQITSIFQKVAADFGVNVVEVKRKQWMLLLCC
jgi:hypothetical protein